MMRASENGIALICEYEGFSATVYRDAAGLPTIGYGHLIRAGECFAEPLSEVAARALLRQDVAVAEQAVAKFITAPLTQNQCDALVSFTFNLGGGVLQRSTLRRVLNRGEYDAVPREMMRYVWAGGRKLPGLIRRRAAEANLFDN
jgi:lysozyme